MQIMYLYDFVRKALRLENSMIIVYLIINVVIIGFIVNEIFLPSVPYYFALLIGFDVYFVSLLIALSSWGEALLRFIYSVNRISENDSKKIMPLFNEVYEKAKYFDKSIPDDVTVFIVEKDYQNAFAMGRKSICVTRGLLSLPDNYIKAIFAHEFGHLSHHDTDLILVISIGNLAVMFFLTLIRIVLHIMFGIISIIFSGFDSDAEKFGQISHFLIDLVFVIWTNFGILLTMHSIRQNEYSADKFASEIGYGRELVEALFVISDIEEEKDFFARLASSHPTSMERKNKLEQYR
jgi:heat shock protein HtpX